MFCKQVRHCTKSWALGVALSFSPLFQYGRLSFYVLLSFLFISDVFSHSQKDSIAYHSISVEFCPSCVVLRAQAVPTSSVRFLLAFGQEPEDSDTASSQTSSTQNALANCSFWKTATPSWWANTALGNQFSSPASCFSSRACDQKLFSDVSENVDLVQRFKGKRMKKVWRCLECLDTV